MDGWFEYCKEDVILGDLFLKSFLKLFVEVAGSRGIRRFWLFGRMGNVNWVISSFRSQGCKRIFLGPRFSDFRHQNHIFLILYVLVEQFWGFRDQVGC